MPKKSQLKTDFLQFLKKYNVIFLKYCSFFVHKRNKKRKRKGRRKKKFYFYLR